MGSCLALGMLLYQQLTQSRSALPPSALPESEAPRQHLAESQRRAAGATPSLSAFSEITQRPLFVASRRLPEPQAAPAPAQQKPFDLVLTGVAILGDKRVAVIGAKSAAQAIRVFEGQTVDGWRVKTISPDHVTFEGDDGERQAEIFTEPARP